LTRDALAEHGFDIGDFTCGVPKIWWWGEPATLVIGKYCSLSADIEIFLGGNHRPDFVHLSILGHRRLARGRQYRRTPCDQGRCVGLQEQARLMKVSRPRCCRGHTRQKT
jgi:hypothetical protein